MNIDLVAEVSLCHNGTLDVPARTALAPRGLPIRLTLFFRFPENEVVRILLALLTGYLDLTESGLEIVKILMGKLSVIFKFPDTVVNRSVSSHIGVTFFDQGADHIQHAADLFCRQRVLCCRLDIHALHILFALGNVALGDRLCINALLDGFFDDLIIDIRKVGYIIYIVSFIFKVPSYRIKYDHRSRVSDVDKVVDGRSAHVHFYFSRLYRNELFFSLCECIVDLHNLSSFIYLSVRIFLPCSFA